MATANNNKQQAIEDLIKFGNYLDDGNDLLGEPYIRSRAEEYVIENQPIKSQDELWDDIFAKIKQYGLNKDVLDFLKSKYNIQEIGE